MRRLSFCVVLLLSAFIESRALVVPQAPPQPPADLVLTDGTVITVDARDSVTEALAVTGGKIVFVGRSADAKRYVGEHTQVIDLHGRTATPGLIDAHCHFSEAADQLDLGDPSIKNMADVIAKVKAWVDKVPPGQWIRGGGWDEGKLAERRYITAADLDKAAPNNPVYLTHTTGHYGVANSLAMKLSGVTKDTPDPPGGTIDRDKDGNPTGVMKERATGLIRVGAGGSSGRGASSGPGQGQRDNILRIMEGFNREGMTAAKDPSINPGKWTVYKQLLDEGKFTVRVFTLWLGGATIDSVQRTIAQLKALPKPPQSLGDGLLLAGGVKLYIDGSGGARTAWVYDDWNKDLTGTDTGNKGYPANGNDYPAIYRQQVRLITEAGLHVGTHAVGDKAIDWVVDSYREALDATKTRDLRDSIIHANIPTDHAIETMAYLQKTYDAGYPEAQAPFMWWIGDTYAGNFGPTRNPRLMPFKTYVRKGIIWAGGSDYSVTPYAARYGLWSSVVRQTFGATYGPTPFGTAEAVDIHTALKSYTIWAAHQLFLEKQIGSLEVGKAADIAVWDKNMYRISSAELKDLKCELTFVAGKVVYQAR
jgi:predicted amidohydrolase YtcJ